VLEISLFPAKNKQIPIPILPLQEPLQSILFKATSTQENKESNRNGSDRTLFYHFLSTPPDKKN
jgi:hypothetical protein